MLMARYRAAVIGCGGRSGPHLEAYRHVNRADVVACCDSAQEKARSTAGRYGLAEYTDAARMLKQESPDLVHIVTPPDRRADLMQLVSEAGIPACTVEKPVATGVADWKRLRELNVASPTKFAVCHQFRWHEHVMRCRDAIRDGDLGDLALLDFSAGFNIAWQGTHILNYARGLNGDQPVSRVFGTCSGDRQMIGIHPGPDTTVGLVAFANGVRGVWNTGYTAPRCGDPQVSWQHVRLAAYGERGRILWEEFGRWEIVSGARREAGDFGDMDTWMRRNIAAQGRFHEAMLDWIEDDAAVPGTALSQSLHEWKVVLALYASAIDRRPLELELFDPPEDLFGRLGDALGAEAGAMRESSG
jgi:predicted dehydrogenase